MSLTILLNGTTRSFPDLAEERASVLELIHTLGLQQDRVALERNGEILARAQWSTTPLAEGDRIELVHFVGGG